MKKKRIDRQKKVNFRGFFVCAFIFPKMQNYI